MNTKHQEAHDRNLIQNHPLFDELPLICDFYKSLSFNCFLYLPAGTRGIVNYNSYLYESLAGTISSIYDIVKKGHLNDACILLRAYFDTILTAVYIDVIRDEQFDVFNNFVVKEVDEWLQAKYRIPSVRKLLSIIKTSLILRVSHLKLLQHLEETCLLYQSLQMQLLLPLKRKG